MSTTTPDWVDELRKEVAEVSGVVDVVETAWRPIYARECIAEVTAFLDNPSAYDSGSVESMWADLAGQLRSLAGDAQTEVDDLEAAAEAVEAAYDEVCCQMDFDE